MTHFARVLKETKAISFCLWVPKLDLLPPDSVESRWITETAGCTQWSWAHEFFGERRPELQNMTRWCQADLSTAPSTSPPLPKPHETRSLILPLTIKGKRSRGGKWMKSENGKQIKAVSGFPFVQDPTPCLHLSPHCCGWNLTNEAKVVSRATKFTLLKQDWTV